MDRHSFQPGEEVIWLKNIGGFVMPVLATVIAITSKRVTITASDPDEKGEGVVTRHVQAASLQPKERSEPRRQPGRGAVRGRRAVKRVPPAEAAFEDRYPNISSWVQDGWIEIGHDDCGRPFLR